MLHWAVWCGLLLVGAGTVHMIWVLVLDLAGRFRRERWRRFWPEEKRQMMDFINEAARVSGSEDLAVLSDMLADRFERGRVVDARMVGDIIAAGRMDLGKMRVV